MLRHRIAVFLLVVTVITGMLPFAVFAEDEVINNIISSAEEPEQTVLPTSITGGAIGIAVDAIIGYFD